MQQTAVRQDALPSHIALFFRGALVGTCVLAITGILVGLAISVWLPSRSKMTIFVLIPAAGIALVTGIGMWILALNRQSIATTRRAATAGIGAGIGMGALILLFSPVSSMVDLLIPATFVLVGTLVTILGWIAINRLLGPVRFADGKSCPACGYCLLGCESMICPECGRTFTYKEIGTTEAEFRTRQVIE